jgi:hypothetical protein
MKVTSINLPEDQREWLEQQPNGIAGTIRELVARAMRRDDRQRLRDRIAELEGKLALPKQGIEPCSWTD